MITLRPARFPDDRPALAQLFLGYIDALCAAMPDERTAITAKYNPDTVDAWLDTFAKIHTAPTGNLLIAWNNNRPAACGMLRAFEPGIAEIQRLFVHPDYRNKGLARQISLALMDDARAAGYHTIRLDTARPLTGAIKLYRSLGFEERSPYHNLTPQMDHFIVYFERPL
ncbi:GNAT family N-acetyltransferase [Pseudorhodobacter ferrugineus]|uniref:GNAT family N-acetyltransferase n=1 Tax=Pseudorhodobacter ferrugineus TaxID=77008 RepID=UPI0003B4D0C2|nr:GNAT family N-acetyltransferase [Pseudorhodobacter ferrugineus]